MLSVILQRKFPFLVLRIHKKKRAIQGAYRAQVNEAIDALTKGLKPFVEKAMVGAYGERWHQHPIIRRLCSVPSYGIQGPPLDAHLLLKIITYDKYWTEIFSKKLSQLKKEFHLESLRNLRNRHAHYDGKDSLFDDRDLVEQYLIQIRYLLKLIDSKAELARVQGILDQLNPSLGKRLRRVLRGDHSASVLVYLGLFLLSTGSFRCIRYWQSPRIEKTNLIIGVPTDNINAYDDLKEALEAKLKPANFWSYLRNETIKISFATTQNHSLATAKLRAQEWDLVLSWTPVLSMEALDYGYEHVGNMFYENPKHISIIFTRKETSINQIEDIQPSTTVALGRQLSLSRFYMPMYMLKGRSMTIITDIENTKIIEMVKNGEADVGVTSVNLSRPDDRTDIRGISELKEVARSAILPNPIMAISPRLSFQDRAVLSQVILTMPEAVRRPNKANFNTGPRPDYKLLQRAISQARALSACLSATGKRVAFVCPLDQIVTTQGWIDEVKILGDVILLTVTLQSGYQAQLTISPDLLAQITLVKDLQNLVGQTIQVSTLQNQLMSNKKLSINNQNQMVFLD